MAFAIGSLAALLNLFLLAFPPAHDTEVLGIIDPLQEEKVYWTEVVTQSPTYRDGWIQLSEVYGESDDALSTGALESAYALDPRIVK